MESRRERASGAGREEETSQVGVGSHVQVGTRQTGRGEGKEENRVEFICLYRRNDSLILTEFTASGRISFM